MPQQLQRFFPYLLLAIFTILFFHRLAFTDLILARGDALSYFYPYWDVRNDAFRAGHLPLWTPDIFMGAPLLADPQLGTYYPPNWIMTPFSAPDGIRYSILLHVWWGAVGAYLLFLHTAGIRNGSLSMPALLAALLFAFGGMLGTRVEQINQLQGLAWLPWLFWLLHRALITPPLIPFATESPPFSKGNGETIMRLLLLAAAWALQLFSGHTQTVFITGLGLGIYALAYGLFRTADWRVRLWQTVRALLILGSAAGLAFLLALPQMLPTLELTGMSTRGGKGFNAAQATAFSLPPTYIGRALFPSLDGLLFGEYIGYVGVIGLGLALYGLLALFWRNRNGEASVGVGAQPVASSPIPSGWGTPYLWALIAFMGVFFAFGRYNPVYFALAELPGFNLFRVPARWLALFGLGIAMLAGLGLQALSRPTAGLQAFPLVRRVSVVLAPLLVLMFATRFMVIIDPTDVRGSALPTLPTFVAWGTGIGALLLLLTWRDVQAKAALPLLAIALVTGELFIASRIMPFNDVAIPAVYDEQRFTVSQLLALQQDQIAAGRVLAISQLYFDPGDKTTLQERFFRAWMDDDAQDYAFTAIKKQETLFPNLALTWGIPSIDGYGGGILPTIYYSQFTSLLLPEGAMRTVDGRLGEMLALPDCRGACIPDQNMLALADVQYLITDKVYDVWQNDVAYDTTLPMPVTTETVAWFHADMPFTADTVQVLYLNHDTEAVTAPVLRFSADQYPLPLMPYLKLQEVAELHLVEYSLLSSFDLKAIALKSATGLSTIYAVTLLDSRTGDFLQLVPNHAQKLLSSDIKLYTWHDLPNQPARIMVAQAITALPDTWAGSEEALRLLQSGEIDPSLNIIVHGYPDSLPLDRHEAEINITAYSAERVEIKVNTTRPDFLFLADAWYPGWQATVNGASVPVYRANIMFRAVPIPAGESTVIFEFVPTLWYNALIAGVVLWGIWLVSMAGFVGWQRRPPTRVE